MHIMTNRLESIVFITRAHSNLNFKQSHLLNRQHVSVLHVIIAQELSRKLLHVVLPVLMNLLTVHVIKQHRSQKVSGFVWITDWTNLIATYTEDAVSPSSAENSELKKWFKISLSAAWIGANLWCNMLVEDDFENNTPGEYSCEMFEFCSENTGNP